LQKELAVLKGKLEHEEQSHQADKHKLTREVDDLKVQTPACTSHLHTHVSLSNNNHMHD